MLCIQIRNMHNSKIRQSIWKIIIGIVHSYFSAVWNIHAELTLKEQLFCTGSFLLQVMWIGKRSIIIGSQIIDRTKHSVIV